MPHMQDYCSSHLHKGSYYDCLFERGSYPHLVWQFERGILTDVIKDRFNGRPFSHLDVACGTGRILEHVRPLAARSCGIDISASMLRIARSRLAAAALTGAALIRGDFAAPNPPFVESFDLITCFRFFLNAEPALRASVASNARALLSNGGLFVFNNHRNYQSLTYRMLRAAGRSPSELACMSHQEAVDLIGATGFRIAAMYHVGIVPGTDQRMYLPYRLGASIERIATKVKALAQLSNDLLYICEPA